MKTSLFRRGGFTLVKTELTCSIWDHIVPPP